MLNRQTYTPALEAEAPPILTTLPEAVAVQLVREMIRLAEKPSAKREAVDIPAKTHGLLLCPRH